MLVLMIMLVVVQALVRSRAARVFVEHQRFDGDRHRVGRHADAAEVDVVEIPQHHAVDHQELAFDIKLVAQDMTERLRHVAIEHDVERQLFGEAIGEPAFDTRGKGGEPRIRRQAGPAQGERDVAVGAVEVECGDVAADRLRNLRGIDAFAGNERRLHDLEIAARQ